MPNLDKLLGLHEPALHLQARRAEILASNLANAETPNYKARDIDFQVLLRQHQTAPGSTATAVKTTHAGHLPAAGGAGPGAPLLYRTPLQPSIDGNTVDNQVEKSEYMQNALRYQATLSFIEGRVQGLRKALKGE